MATTQAARGADTDVLIVGAGPTGLTLATTLLQSGVTPVIVDRLSTGQNTSRAAVIHAHTLEALEPLGVCEKMLEQGLKLTKFSIRDRDRVLVRLQFDGLPSRYPFLLMLPQDRTEVVLAAALSRAGGSVRWGSAVEALRQSADHVDATVVSSEGRQTIRARFVVGADGMHSVVRESAGIGFSGHSYEHSFVLADVDMAWEHGRDEVMLFFSPAGLVVVAPLPDERFRVVATLDEAPEVPSVADVQALLDARGPTRGVCRVQRVHWGSRFRLHHRVADRYRQGRLLLVGDAAHVHSPAGGQGMNTGLVDARVLGRLLAEVVSGRAADQYLDHYETLRRPAAKEVLILAGRLTDMATMRSAPPRLLRNMFLGTIGQTSRFRRTLEMNLSGLSRRAAAEVPARAASSPSA
jgi:2-polyprenyl-6-methoxyphenol hydroxylase-like FAD-dependent oxidoreductase